ncbi:MATE family efflux transporter [Helicobacter sp. 23-1045]
MSRKLDLRTAPMPKLFIAYSLPALISMLVLSTYVVVDGIFVGRGIGELGLAAIGLSVPIFTFFTGIELLFGIGGAALVSIALGAKKERKANIIFNSVIYTTLLFGASVGILLYIFRENLATILGANEILRPYLLEYLNVIVLGGAIIMAQSVLCAFARNDGAPNLTMISFTAGAICNIILNYIFIFILRWGMFGSAFATILGHFVGLIIILKHFLRKEGKLHFMLILSPSAFKKSIISGIAPSMSEFAFGAIILFMNILLSRLDSTQGIAILSIMLYIGFVFFGCVLALSHGMQPIVSYNFGARERFRTISAFKIAAFTALIFGLVVYIIMFCFTPQIARIFLKQSEMGLLDELIIAVRIYFLGYLFLGFNIISSAFLQATQRIKGSLIISLCHNLIFMAILLPIMAHFFGVRGIWASYPIALFCAFLVSIMVLKSEFRRLK